MIRSAVTGTKNRFQPGQATLELALILPVLLLLVFGMIEFGRLYSVDLGIANAARDGARAAAVGATDAQVTDIVQKGVQALTLTPSELGVVVTPVLASRVRGATVRVYVYYPVRIYTPVISNVIGETHEVSSAVYMRVE